MEKVNHPPAAPAECWSDVGELRMRYLDWGGDGQPVLALHGLASSAHWYDLVAPHLRQRYRVIAPDQRGHGRTTQTGSGYDWHTLASDLAGLLDCLGLERVAVLGHSWGGHVASSLAALFPQRVSCLVMIDGGFQNGHLLPGGTWESFRARFAPRDVSGTRQQLLAHLRAQLSDCWNEQVERIVLTMVREDAQGQVQDILHPDNHAQVLQTMWQEPPSEVLPRVQCPALIVPAGPKPDRANTDFARLREKMVAAAQGSLADCRVCWIPETIHDIGYHKPGELARTIDEFISGNGLAGR